MTGVPVDSLAAKQNFAFRPAPQRASRDFFGMHHLRMLAAALAVGVSLLYRCRFQRIGLTHALLPWCVTVARPSLRGTTPVVGVAQPASASKAATTLIFTIIHPFLCLPSNCCTTPKIP